MWRVGQKAIDWRTRPRRCAISWPATISRMLRWLRSLLEALRRFEQTVSIAALASEVLETLPGTHPGFAQIADEEAKAHLEARIYQRRATALQDSSYALRAAGRGRAGRPTTSATCRCPTTRWATSTGRSGRVSRRGRPSPSRWTIRERLAGPSRTAPTTSATCRSSYNKMGDLYGALGPGRAGPAGLRQVAGNPRAAGRSRAGPRGLPARPVGRPTTRWATCTGPSVRGEQARRRTPTSLAIAERLAGR